MYVAKVLVIAVFSCMMLLCQNHLLAFDPADHCTRPAALCYTGDVAINCGSVGKSNAFDGREWIGDAGSEVMSSLRPKGKSKSSTAVDKSLSADPVPYKTSRISTTPFYYKFPVSPGQKFIRLHFHRAPYYGFKHSEDFFTVKAGPFTLLHNFSASLAAESFGVNFFVKEFCLSIEEKTDLIVTFAPSYSSKTRKVHAFVNGIEILSMPTGLYYTRNGDLGARIVGLHNRFLVIDNSIALELMERLNTGAISISSTEDFGLFRRWNGDANYLIETKIYQVSHPAHRIQYTSVPAYVAPPKVYQTSWKIEPNVRVQELYTFRWRIPIDVGFGYLVRLHFCEFDSRKTDGGNKEFSVLMNDQFAETKIDITSWGGGSGVPVYSDYMVMMKGDKEDGKRDLLIALRSKNELVVGLLNGLEIFKLSNPDNSLATPNPVLPKRMSSSLKQKIQKLFTPSQSNVIVTGTVFLLALVNTVFYNLRQIWEASMRKENNIPFVSIDPSFHCFSLAEILSATQNFSDVSVIGRGGFGKVYKGFISGISQIVAIKRLNANSKQGAREFWTEVETLSKFRHVHLVSLIGYCNECSEMILVYEYMPRGTLADNIYRLGKTGKDILSWEQRLRICIGAARGLEFLHTGTEHGVIHRDVKDTNILLDENFTAKISDFGLSKLEKFSQSKSYISTKVKGTYGYLDPEYHMTRKLTRKVDVYAFAVVLLVVVSGRPAVDVRNPEEPQSLLSRFRECMTEGDFEGIVDPSLQGRISLSSLREFVKSVENCLHHQPKKRPTMAQVATSLELALEEHESAMLPVTEAVAEISQPFEDESMESMQLSQNPAPSMLEESVTSSPNEGITKKPIQNPLSPIRAKDTQLRQSREDSSSARKPIWGWPWKTMRSRVKPMKKTDLVSSYGSSPRSSVDEKINGFGPCFSIQDIRAAADNFTDGFQTVDARRRKAHKGFMKQIQKQVIIYEINIETYSSEASEVYREIEKLSELRHLNLQSLIGYCLNEPETQMFIVYEYIGFDSLDNHLYSRTINAPLSWKRRLDICLGVAKGLAYLQVCTKKKINHYDLSLESILLDQNWSPKISHFGLPHLNLNRVAHDTLPIEKSDLRWNNYGLYVQPVQEKSDLCSFGLVLLEVLFARRLSLDDIDGYLVSLQRSIARKTFHMTIDSTLKEQIAGECLAEYLKIIFICLFTSTSSMADVILKLKLALELQEKAEAAKQQANKEDSYCCFTPDDIYQGVFLLDTFHKTFRFKH